ncbi:MAG: hypothetical protein GY803_10540 [Chloroflexi bacterium]|nr:hypothetical protein [Chloroflexota bacterium]
MTLNKQPFINRPIVNDGAASIVQRFIAGRSVAIILIFLLTGCRQDEVLPPLVTEIPSKMAFASLTAVTAAPSPPTRDMVDLAARFRGINAPRVARAEPIPYQIGDTDLFWAKDLAESGSRQVEATLVYRSEALNMWVETGAKVNDDDLNEAATFIETQILPTNRAFFGREWQPGVDGDNRVNVLHLKELTGVGVAYFWSGDEMVTAVNPYSNQREMLTVSLKHGKIGSDAYYQAIAHEMQHLIQWRADPNEDAWLGEGLSELAVHINGFDTGRANDYANNPDIQLTGFSHEPDVIGGHYAHATQFAIYFLDRFGEEATQTLAQRPENGAAGFAQMLAELDSGLTDVVPTFDDLFADWAAANYLAGIGRGEGVYQYRSLDMPAIKPEKIQRFPASGAGTVNQYGADYVKIESDEPVIVSFTGSRQVNLVDAKPHSGSAFWMSLPGDEADMTLTRPFDLSGLESATLTFWTWYEIESGWDYGYVAVSADDDRTWQLLETQSTTRDNPEGNSLGPGYTGNSGSGETPAWVQETADLTPYAGQNILLRFEYVTDDAVHEQGFLIDDIAIPELNYLDDVEEADDWTAAGFVRAGHILPQTFIVQRILIGKDSVQVERLPLNEAQRGQWEFPMDKETDEAILIISGNTPVTTATAVYEYTVTN